MTEQKVLSAVETEAALREAGFGDEIIEGAADLAVMLEAVPQSLVDKTLARLAALPRVPSPKLTPHATIPQPTSKGPLGQGLMVMGALAIGVLGGMLGGTMIDSPWRKSSGTASVKVERLPRALELLCSARGQDTRSWQALTKEPEKVLAKGNRPVIYSFVDSRIECPEDAKLSVRLDPALERDIKASASASAP